MNGASEAVVVTIGRIDVLLGATEEVPDGAEVLGQRSPSVHGSVVPTGQTEESKATALGGAAKHALLEGTRRIGPPGRVLAAETPAATLLHQLSVVGAT